MHQLVTAQETKIGRDKTEVTDELEALDANMQLELSELRLFSQEFRFMESAYHEIANSAELEEKVATLTQLLKNAESQISQLTATTDGNCRLIQTLTFTNENLESQLTASLKHQVAVEGDLVEAEKTKSELREQLNQLQENQLQLDSSSQEKQKLCAELTSQKAALDFELQRTVRELENCQAVCLELKETMQKLEEQSNADRKMAEQKADLFVKMEEALQDAEQRLSQLETGQYEEMERKDRLVSELHADLEAMSGSLQRRERMWETARESMEQEIETLRTELSHQTSELDAKLSV